MTKVARDAGGTRERLLDAVEGLVAERGMHGTGLNEVCRVSGVAYGSLYHAFPGGKDHLVAASVRRSGERIGAVLEVLFASTTDVAGACRAVFDAGAAQLAADDFSRGCPIGVPVADGHITDAVREAGGSVFADWSRTIAAGLRRAGAEADVAQATASTMVSLYEGALLVARARRDVGVLTDAGALAERLAREVVR